MSENMPFSNHTPRFGLPYLFAGQSQREFYVNEALARLDLLLHPVVEGSFVQAPEEPTAGEIYLVDKGATGDWTGRDDSLAGWDGQQWTYAAPVKGMTVFERNRGKKRCYLNGWSDIEAIENPTGGETIDVEARHAITQLIETLEKLTLI
ncbi:DUF2793 domain-containing protein [Erythrobacter litoralis]|uniref:DUF2793 domain-containing protein n=1 Tax=Erythrobacter litoralis TaxID=39960 RepID=UPI00243592C8|nr:DUF2793 domain-containing protein [Erythrobacter litoralis]MDG6079192.1 DUF2793 domain-containing protein [Erythrobacter litoralis]